VAFVYPVLILLRATAWENWHILGKSNSHYFLLSWKSHQIFLSLYKKYKLNIFGLKNWFCNFLENSFLLFYLKIFKITKRKNKIYGSLIVFLYKNWLSHLEKCQKLGMGFFFYFLSFATFIHFSDENLACEHELNIFFSLI
jgi:hypothetical protein